MNVTWILITRDMRVGFESLSDMAEFVRNYGIKDWRHQYVGADSLRRS